MICFGFRVQNLKFGDEQTPTLVYHPEPRVQILKSRTEGLQRSVQGLCSFNDPTVSLIRTRSFKQKGRGSEPQNLKTDRRLKGWGSDSRICRSLRSPVCLGSKKLELKTQRPTDPSPVSGQVLHSPRLFYRGLDWFYWVLNWFQGVLDWFFRALSRFRRLWDWSCWVLKWFQEFWTQISGFGDESFDADHPLADFSHMIDHQGAMDLIRWIPATRLQLCERETGVQTGVQVNRWVMRQEVGQVTLGQGVHASPDR